MARKESRPFCGQGLGEGHSGGPPLEVALRLPHLPVAFLFRSRAALSLATNVAFSNWATPPSTWRMSTAVGVSSRKCCGEDAAISVILRAFRRSWPSNCWMRSPGELVGALDR